MFGELMLVPYISVCRGGVLPYEALGQQEKMRDHERTCPSGDVDNNTSSLVYQYIRTLVDVQS